MNASKCLVSSETLSSSYYELFKELFSRGGITSIKRFGFFFYFLGRYSRHDKRSKLPGWILSHLRDAHLNLSTDMAVHIAREVFLSYDLTFSL